MTQQQTIMQHRSLPFAAFVAAVLGLTSIAWTAEPKRTQSPPGKPSHGTASDASALYAEAEKLYQKGDLNGAVQKLRECYEKTHDVNLLFNLAQLYRELADCTAALAHYQRYVQQAGDAGRVPDAKRYIDELAKECAAEAPAQKTPMQQIGAPTARESRSEAASVRPNVAMPPPRVTGQRENSPALERRSHWTTLGWCAFGAGVALGGASTYFIASALEARRDTETTDRGPDYNRRASDLARDTVLAATFGAASAATLGLAAYALLYAAPKERQSSSAATAWALGWSLAGPTLVYYGRF